MNFGQGKVREFHFRLRVGTLNDYIIALSIPMDHKRRVLKGLICLMVPF